MTPATFMVSALVLPISMNTLMLRPKAAAALDRNMGMSRRTCKPSFHHVRAFMTSGEAGSMTVKFRV